MEEIKRIENLNKLKADIELMLQNKIKDFIETLENQTLYFVRPNDVISELIKYEGIRISDDGIECNGYSWDYWEYFYYKDNKYCITGDGYYQNYCEITKYD